MMNWLIYVFWWFAGTDAETIKTCGARDQGLRTALGLVFLLNYAALLLAWLKVGTHYYGLAGILPGLLIPSIFLALDRIIAMRHRNLSGILAVYNIGQADDKTEAKLRVAMALALSLATTFTFQLDQASSLIREKTQAQWKTANSELRKEITTKVEAEYKQKFELINLRKRSLDEDRKRTSDRLNDAIATSKNSSQKATTARDQQSREKGGLDGLHAGEKTRFHAQGEIAEQNEKIMKAANSSQTNAESKLKEIDQKLDALLQEHIKAETDKVSNLEKEVVNVMKKDERFVAEQSGIFSDATIFIKLFFEPDVAAGMFVMSLLIWGVLLTLELSALLAMRILPASAYEIALIANLRVKAAQIVATAEIKLAQQASLSPPIHVRARPGPGNQHQNQGNPINQ